ncbi:hypothetical protein ALC53_13083 [Atta colombica]|uniref:ascorbate ferrireductase (transmembrane) n=1 Tax=Atta colombica TaxID=520822 RepID=A0A151HZ33_9HYME|nr:hypothetical protein ALC53_13083 [Atta colombica]
MKKDIVLDEKEDKDPVIIIDDWEREEEEEKDVYMGVDQLYVLLMSEATLILASDNMLTASLSHHVNKHLHWILQVVGVILTLVGVGMKYNAKSVHFLSIHSITGISSLVIICIVTLLGYPVWIAWKLRKFVRPMIIKFFHNFLATIGFIIGMVSQCYGYKKTWVHHEMEMKHADDMLLVLTILITILSLRGALNSLYRQAISYLKLICFFT